MICLARNPSGLQSMFFFSLKFLMAKIAHFKHAKHQQSLLQVTFHLCHCSNAVLRSPTSAQHKMDKCGKLPECLPQIPRSRFFQPVSSNSLALTKEQAHTKLHRHDFSTPDTGPVSGYNFVATIGLIIDKSICQVHIQVQNA